MSHRSDKWRIFAKVGAAIHAEISLSTMAGTAEPCPSTEKSTPVACSTVGLHSTII